MYTHGVDTSVLYLLIILCLNIYIYIDIYFSPRNKNETQSEEIELFTPCFLSTALSNIIIPKLRGHYLNHKDKYCFCA